MRLIYNSAHSYIVLALIIMMGKASAMDDMTELDISTISYSDFWGTVASYEPLSPSQMPWLVHSPQLSDVQSWTHFLISKHPDISSFPSDYQNYMVTTLMATTYKMLLKGKKISQENHSKGVKHADITPVDSPSLSNSPPIPQQCLFRDYKQIVPKDEPYKALVSDFQTKRRKLHNYGKKNKK